MAEVNTIHQKRENEGLDAKEIPRYSCAPSHLDDIDIDIGSLGNHGGSAQTLQTIISKEDELEVQHRQIETWCV